MQLPAVKAPVVIAGGLAMWQLLLAAQELEIIGTWPGYARKCPLDIVVEANHAYAACGYGGLVILDVANPSEPVVLGRYVPSTDGVSSVHVAAGVAYVTEKSDGLDVVSGIVDVSNPAAPVKLGTLPLVTEKMALTGNRAYVAYHGLRVLDVSNPAVPVELGNSDDWLGIGLNRGAVAVAGSHAFVADGSFYVYDISNDAQPFYVASLETRGDAVDVAVVGRYAYVADCWNGMLIIDVADPLHPVEVGCYQTGALVSVVVDGKYAYLAGGEYVSIVDISNPQSVRFVGHVDVEWVFDMALQGGYAYVASDSLEVLDVRNVAHPTVVRVMPFEVAANDVAVLGTHALLADGRAGLRIIDFTQPTAPILLGSYPTDSEFFSVAASGSIVFVTDESGLKIINVDRPESPWLMGSVTTPGSAEDVAVAGSFAYVADGPCGLQVVDVHWPNAPKIVGTCETDGWAEAVFVCVPYAYLADRWGGFKIVDVTSALAPKVVGAFPSTAGWVEDVTVRDKVAFLAVGSSLRIVDVQNPAAPTETGAYFRHSDVDAVSVAVGDSCAYYADMAGLHLIDVRDVTRVSRVGGIWGSQMPWGHGGEVLIQGDILLMTASQWGLAFLRTKQELRLFDPALKGKLFSVKVPSVAGRLYVLEHRDVLTDVEWVALPPVQGIDGILTLEDSEADSARRFYRVREQ